MISGPFHYLSRPRSNHLHSPISHVPSSTWSRSVGVWKEIASARRCPPWHSILSWILNGWPLMAGLPAALLRRDSGPSMMTVKKKGKKIALRRCLIRYQVCLCCQDNYSCPPLGKAILILQTVQISVTVVRNRVLWGAGDSKYIQWVRKTAVMKRRARCFKITQTGGYQCSSEPQDGFKSLVYYRWNRKTLGPVVR